MIYLRFCIGVLLDSLNWNNICLQLAGHSDGPIQSLCDVVCVWDGQTNQTGSYMINITEENCKKSRAEYY
jgi:hypothetical protein